MENMEDMEVRQDLEQLSAMVENMEKKTAEESLDEENQISSLGRRSFKSFLPPLIVLAMVLLIVAFLAYVKAGENRGDCGAGLKWQLKENTLYITGSGIMDEYAPNTVPWRDKRDSIKRIEIEDGVASIGQNAFENCSVLEEVYIPDSVKKKVNTPLRPVSSLSR